MTAPIENLPGATVSVESGWSFARSAYVPWLELRPLVASVLRDFAHTNGVRSAAVSLSDGVTLPSRVECGSLGGHWSESVLALRLDLDYAGQQLGTLLVQTEPDWSPEGLATHCRRLASDLSLLIHRDRVRQWSLEHLGLARTFVGLSPSLRAVERQIERASRTSLPVMLRGEFGVETLTAAIALHCGGDRREDDLLVLRCATLDAERLARELERRQASRLTLFLQSVDELGPAAQRTLLSLLPPPLGLPGKASPGPRLVASTSSDLHELVQAGRFSRALLSELDVLSITLPPLRTRMDDVSDLIGWILHDHHGSHPASSLAPKTCEPELERLLRAHSWPGDQLELERTLLQLAVMSEADTIGLADVHHCTPPLVLPAPFAGKVEAELEPHARRLHARDHPTPSRSLDSWVEALSSRDFTRFEALHEGLQRALVHLSEHYREPLSLGELARRSALSPSHLSFLFKSSLGVSFKTLLAGVRVEKAKQLLTEPGQRRSITDVAAEAGFGDLSHFEKTFRRLVHVCPREYRRRSVAAS